MKRGEDVKHAAAGKEVHECERKPDAMGTIFVTEKGWNIQVEEHGDIEPIQYCPYCGTKLV